MTEILTSEEQNVLANYHLNSARDFIYEIITEMTKVNKKPVLEKIDEMVAAFNREIKIVKHYKQDEGLNENNR